MSRDEGFDPRAKKHLGQNFLHERGVIAKIVQAIDPRPDDRIVEIGPGQGALTFPLLDRHGTITAIEFDRDLLLPLAAAARAHGELVLLNANVLDVDFTALAEGGQLRLVGNLPYNLSSPILFHALDHAAAIQDMHFMLQKEVVERMVAAPSTSDYGRLSIMLQRRFHLEWLLDVPPAAFDPPPRVDSAVVRLIPRSPSDIAALDDVLFARVVAAAFAQRRKTLRNTLGAFLKPDDFAALSIDAGLRAEALPLSDYVAITQYLTAHPREPQPS